MPPRLFCFFQLAETIIWNHNQKCECEIYTDSYRTTGFSSFRTLCENLEELPLLFVVSSHKLFMELLKEEERKVLLERMRKRSATINLSAKPLPSFYDIPGAPLRLFNVTRLKTIMTAKIPKKNQF